MEINNHKPLIFNIVFYTVIFVLVTLQNSKPENTYYLLTELIKQISILYVVCGIVSLLVLIIPLIQSFENLIFPACIVVTAFIGSFLMTYRQTTNCGKKKYSVAIYNSLIPTFTTLLGYALANKIGWMQQGFHDTVSNGDFSNTGKYMAICYWSSILLMPSVTLAYFGTENYACNDNTDIVIKDIEDMKYV